MRQLEAKQYLVQAAVREPRGRVAWAHEGVAEPRQIKMVHAKGCVRRLCVNRRKCISLRAIIKSIVYQAGLTFCKEYCCSCECLLTNCCVQYAISQNRAHSLVTRLLVLAMKKPTTVRMCKAGLSHVLETSKRTTGMGLQLLIIRWRSPHA